MLQYQTTANPYRQGVLTSRTTSTLRHVGDQYHPGPLPNRGVFQLQGAGKSTATNELLPHVSPHAFGAACLTLCFAVLIVIRRFWPSQRLHYPPLVSCAATVANPFISVGKGHPKRRPVVLYAKPTSIAGRLTGETSLVEIEGDWDLNKLYIARDILQKGGLGIIPTDTSYAFVCDVHSRQGVQRIFQIKNVTNEKKPLSILCKDLSTISKYAAKLTNQNYRLLKECLPGPYTFILPASTEVPKVWLNHKSHEKTWKRKEIGVRMPDDEVCQALLNMLDFPLLCSTVDPEKGIDPFTIEESYRNQLDFVVAAGVRGSPDGEFSSVVDITGDLPKLLRKGLGDVSFCPEPEEEE